jgi:hypothetical protein
MIHWKISVLSVALGAAAAAGFVWLGRRPRRPLISRAAPALAGTSDYAGEERAEGGAHPIGYVAERDERAAWGADEAARLDALHDLEVADPENAELDLEAALERIEPIEIEPSDDETVEFRPLEEESLTSDEPYDAVDPESIGSEFLRRATESPALDKPHESAFDVPVDVAVELPVGRLDFGGNAELHGPARERKAETDLSPNDEELLQRRSDEAAGGPQKPHG